MYTCVAKTPTTGTDTASGELVVEGIKPAIEDHSDLHQFVQEDDDYQVLCKIIGGDPKPEQKWYKVCLSILVSILYHFILKHYFTFLKVQLSSCNIDKIVRNCLIRPHDCC